ncbi:MAG TPA: hypothetical protein VGR73_21920 [Bryobacteraceae bacterium]|nr:hypothetical protein [Bryobacteraceae bacterium]
MTGEAIHRVWCSEILSLRLESKSGRPRKLNVNLEEIWPSGALCLTSARIPPQTPLRFACGGREFRGKAIAQTLSKGLGYFVEIRFDGGCQWSAREYRPKHFLNPMVLLASRFFEAALRKPGGAAGSFPLASPFAASVSSAATNASSQETVAAARSVRRVA